MPQAATIKSLPRAFRMMKAMQAQEVEWGADDRQAAGAALKDILEGRMAAGIEGSAGDPVALLIEGQNRAVVPELEGVLGRVRDRDGVVELGPVLHRAPFRDCELVHRWPSGRSR